MSEPVIAIKNISFSYSGHEVIKNCSAKVEKGTITALLGANGQGKTTLIKCLLNYLKLSGGVIEILGKDIRKYTIREFSRTVSYVPQAASIAGDIIARDYIVEGRTPYMNIFAMPGEEEYAKVGECAEMLGITKLLGKNVNHLSGGQLQSVMIARALVQDTDIILMDEPMAALDLSLQAEFLRLAEELKNLGKTIIFTTHNPEHALVLNCNTWIMSKQKIACSGFANEILTNDILKELYGDGVCLIEYRGRKICLFDNFTGTS